MTPHVVEKDFESIVANLGSDAERLSGKTLLITGGAGFLGSHIVGVIRTLNRTVLREACRVISVDNFLTGSKRNLLIDIDDPNITFIEHDVRNKLDLPGPIDYLIHAAGVASPVYYKKYPLETIEGTIFGVKHLLDLAREKQATGMLYFSSSEIYGDPDPNFIPTPEAYKGNVSSIGPRACYDESKRLGETLCMTYFRQFGVPVKIVRPFNVYGPGMKLNDYRVVPTFILKALEGGPLPVHDKGNQTRTFCYVSDAVAGFLKVLLSGRAGEVYNVGNDQEEINMLALAEKIADIFGPTVRAQLVSYPDTYPQDEPRRRCPDLAKIKGELAYHPAVDLKNGLERTIEWLKEERAKG